MHVSERILLRKVCQNAVLFSAMPRHLRRDTTTALKVTRCLLTINEGFGISAVKWQQHSTHRSPPSHGAALFLRPVGSFIIIVSTLEPATAMFGRGTADDFCRDAHEGHSWRKVRSKHYGCILQVYPPHAAVHPAWKLLHDAQSRFPSITLNGQPAQTS